MWRSLLRSVLNDHPKVHLRPDGVCAPGDGYIYDLGSRACRAMGGEFLPGVADGAWWQLVTSQFTHVQLWHIAGNMLALYFLGPQLEAVLGRVRFLALYLLSGQGARAVETPLAAVSTAARLAGVAAGAAAARSEARPGLAAMKSAISATMSGRTRFSTSFAPRRSRG